MFNFVNLDDETRKYMLQSIVEAEKSENIYYSKRFNEAGKDKWLPLLKKAAKDHDEHWLAYQLQANSLMKCFEIAQKPKGGYSTKYVPHSAAETMAEGQFNRFYILGLCKRADMEGYSNLIVYRAKHVSSPRTESKMLIGKAIPIGEIEDQLKITENSFKSDLVKPNSGLSVKLP